MRHSLFVSSCIPVIPAQRNTINFFQQESILHIHNPGLSVLPFPAPFPMRHTDSIRNSGPSRDPCRIFDKGSLHPPANIFSNTDVLSEFPSFPAFRYSSAVLLLKLRIIQQILVSSVFFRFRKYDRKSVSDNQRRIRTHTCH